MSATATMITRTGDERPRVDRLAEDDRAEDDRDDRVDVGVGRDERQRRDPQEPAVDGEGEQAADDLRYASAAIESPEIAAGVEVGRTPR